MYIMSSIYLLKMASNGPNCAGINFLMNPNFSLCELILICMNLNRTLSCPRKFICRPVSEQASQPANHHHFCDWVCRRSSFGTALLDLSHTELQETQEQQQFAGDEEANLRYRVPLDGGVVVVELGYTNAYNISVALCSGVSLPPTHNFYSAPFTEAYLLHSTTHIHVLNIHLCPIKIALHRNSTEHSRLYFIWATWSTHRSTIHTRNHSFVAVAAEIMF